MTMRYGDMKPGDVYDVGGTVTMVIAIEETDAHMVRITKLLLWSSHDWQSSKIMSGEWPKDIHTLGILIVRGGSLP